MADVGDVLIQAISFSLGRGIAALDAIDVVHIDAHADFLDEVDGARLTGASQLRRLAELPPCAA